MPDSRHDTCALLWASLAVASALLSSSSLADDVILIGGGYTPLRSEAQIEANVIWAQETLRQQGLAVETWFTDGNASGADVVTVEHTEGSPTEPLARVFGDRYLERLRYREHQVQNVTGSTDADELLPTLQTRLADSDDDVLLVYNGHGSESSGQPADVSISLWNDSSISAREMHELLADSDTSFRYIFTQCFSGGFHRLAYEDADQGLALSEPPRCGFTAESAYRLAEGCSASLAIGDYRDYSTYFFAALSGRDRAGKYILNDPDLNEDGIISPREAHLFTLEEAHSADLSRSSSEDYLEAWQPWYLRWLPRQPQLPDNEYARLYRNIATRLGIELDNNTAKQLKLDIRTLQARLHELTLTRTSLRQRERELQDLMIQSLMRQYPALLGPYTAGFAELVNSGTIFDIANSIAATPDYTDLVAMQSSDDALDTQLLETERELVQRMKLLRMRRLAHLVDQLARHGSQLSQDRYAALLSCEERPLQ